MTNFELKGSELQYRSATPEIAERNYQTSCEICCFRGMHIRCDRCPIAAAHDIVMGKFEEAKLNNDLMDKIKELQKRYGLA